MVRATEYKCKERDRGPKEQSINSINNQVMMAEIIKDLTIIKDTSEVTSNECYHRQKSIKAQWSQKATLDCLSDGQEFDMVSETKHKTETKQHMS